MKESVFSFKLYFVGLIDYMLAAVVFWDQLDHGLRTIAAIGVILSTWYLIKKYQSEKKLNDEKTKRERLEQQIKEQELADILLKRNAKANN